MFDELFDGPIARARQAASPYPDARRHFLSHLKRLGYARATLKVVACELIIIADRIDLSGAAPIDVAVRVDTLCHLQQIAIKLKRKLRWDPGQETFVNDAEANRMLDRPMRAPWQVHV